MSYSSRNRYAAGNISLILCLALVFSLTFTALPQKAQAALPDNIRIEKGSVADYSSVQILPVTDDKFTSILEDVFKGVSDTSAISKVVYSTYGLVYAGVYQAYELAFVPQDASVVYQDVYVEYWYYDDTTGKLALGSVEVPVPIPKSGGGDQGGGGGGGGGGAPAPSPSVDFGQVTTNTQTGAVTATIDVAKAAELLTESGSIVTFEVPVPAGMEMRSADVQLPTATLTEASKQGKAIAIKLPMLTLTIPPKAVPEAALAGSQNVSFKVEILSGSAGARLTDGLPSQYRQASDVIDLELTAGESRVAFAAPVTLQLSCQANGNANFLGVYRYNEATGAWDYVGGHFDAASQAMTVKLGSFSKYAVLAYRKVFSDTVNHWAKADIEIMAARHIAKGISATLFAPEEPVTRAEFAALLVRSLGLREEPAATMFADVPADRWYAGAVAAAYKAGLVKGSAGHFQPEARISRVQMAAMVARALAYAGKSAAVGDAEATLAEFSDKAAIQVWAKAEVAAAVQAGIITGLPDGTFAPGADATRAQAVVMLKRLLVTTGELGS